jgi:hypothetical protein
MLIDAKPGKVFELPKAGLKLGVLADVVYVKQKMTPFGLKDIARFVWLLEAKDTEGNNFRVMREVNQSMADNSSMYALLTEIRGGTPPPVPFDPDSLIGTSSVLGITRTSGADKKTGKPREYANVNSVNVIEEGQPTFAIPAGFVRDVNIPRDAKGNKIKTQTAAPQGAQAAAAQQPAASAPATPAAAASTSDAGEVEVDL